MQCSTLRLRAFIKVNCPMEMLEQHIASGCRCGDDTARRELYERFAKRLYNICMRYVVDRDSAEDLLHDIFIRIFSSFDKFEWRGEGSLRAWVERIAVNMSLEYLRKKSKVNFTSDVDLLANTRYDEPVVDADEVRNIPGNVLAGFIDRLPVGYRTVFNLYCIEGYSHRDIARMLGINERSSSSQLSRAKAMLADMIRKYIKNKE